MRKPVINKGDKYNRLTTFIGIRQIIQINPVVIIMFLNID